MSNHHGALAKAYAATGMLGSGFLADSLRTALSWKPDFIGCDAGSTDGGPSYLATGTSMFSAESTKRDLKSLLAAAREADIPLIIGSAGTGGANTHLAWTRELLLEAARELKLSFRLACISSELERDYVKRAWRDERISPLRAAPTISDAVIDRSLRIVGMMGPEPILAALQQGADVVLCGRASDAAIYAALPISKGVAPGVAWHAAKVLECGAAAVTHRTTPDGMFVSFDRDAFTIEPPNPQYRCTPLSVAAHALYENADPYQLHEPPGTVDLRQATYTAVDDRSVRVTGSTFRPAEQYTIKLEGVEVVGSQSIVIGGVRDPYILRQLQPWLQEMERASRERIEQTFPGVEYTLNTRIYGWRGVMEQHEPTADPAHEVLLIFEVTSEAQDAAHGMANAVRHIALHFPIQEWHGLITTLAHPYTPGVLDRGEVHRFNLNHVLAVDDPLECFPTSLMEVQA